MVCGIVYEIYHFNWLIFTTFITYCAVLRSFDGKSVKIFIKVCQKIEIHKSTIKRLVVLRLNVPVNNFSVMSGRSHRFLGN